MRLRDEVVGALNLFRTDAGNVLNEQFQTALSSRVLIERAKGKLAERLDIDMEQAFSALRAYAHAHNRRLSDLARTFTDGTEPLNGLIV